MIWGYQFHSFFAILSMHFVFFLYRIQNCDEKCHFLRPMVLGISLGWSGSRQDQWSKASDNGASKEPMNPESVKRFFGTILVNHWAGCRSGRSHSVYRDMLCSIYDSIDLDNTQAACHYSCTQISLAWSRLRVCAKLCRKNARSRPQ